MEVCRADPHHYQQEPYQVDTVTTVSGVVLVKHHQEGRHHEEEYVGDCVDELRDVGGEGVVLLTPVNGTGAPLQVTPHAGVLAITSARLEISNYE